MQDDQADAERLDRARTAIAAAGASSLPKRPWIAGGQPHADLDLVLFAVRSEGMTWSAIADAWGLGSAQAAQQRSERIVSRGQQS